MWTKKGDISPKDQREATKIIVQKNYSARQLIIFVLFYLHFTIFGTGYTIKMSTKKIVT